jgi:hypothetical protein
VQPPANVTAALALLVQVVSTATSRHAHPTALSMATEHALANLGTLATIALVGVRTRLVDLTEQGFLLMAVTVYLIALLQSLPATKQSLLPPCQIHSTMEATSQLSLSFLLQLSPQRYTF